MREQLIGNDAVSLGLQSINIQASRLGELVEITMDTDAVTEVGVSLDDANSADPGAESSKIDLVVEMSSNGETSSELVIADEIITRMELDLACASEKLVNLSVLMMYVESKESEFETTAALEGDILGDMAEVLEFDFLSRILDFEVTELDKFMATLQENIVEAHEMISSYKHLGQTFMAMKEKLLDSEKSLKQSHDQISEIRTQFAKFQRTLSCLNGQENWSGNEVSSFSEDDRFVDMNAKLKMQTAEQQRHILRMLEKSLAREMDLEKKLIESRQIEEGLKHRMLSTEQAIFFLEEEAIDVCERWFAAENGAEVLMGISQELLSRLKIFQFNLNGSVKREAELRSNLDKSMEQLEAKENALQEFSSSSVKLSDSLKASLTEAEEKLILANCEGSTLREKVHLLEKQLEEPEYQLSNENVNVYMDGREKQHSALCSEITTMENTIKDLKEELTKEVCRADSAESKCKSLAETNLEINEEMSRLKDASEKVDSLEKQLIESDIRLQHAVASADASQENENMLYATIRDMENLIEDLKLKMQKADSRADNAEDKCILLSDSNAELNEELSFLRARLACLEISLSRAEERKMIAAKDISFRTKVMTELLMQLAIERERLHKQMTSLALENKTLVLKLRQTGKDPFVVSNHNNRGSGGKSEFPEHDEVTQISAFGSKLEKKQKNVCVVETEAADADSVLGAESVRRIDAGMLNYKHIIMAVFILLISAAVYLFLP